ncbi:hypothetical protein TNCT_340151 [Trichonephila clavata]|uniref:Uncharacterized protein n=1 Tax=Trichonephila clavata TaxID=2740835 RepID=A0A8X6FMK3_TRICU|nr:hypothetical protein TNCT_340151 [Trichonephila clavata]
MSFRPSHFPYVSKAVQQKLKYQQMKLIFTTEMNLHFLFNMSININHWNALLDYCCHQDLSNGWRTTFSRSALSVSHILAINIISRPPRKVTSGADGSKRLISPPVIKWTQFRFYLLI